MNRNYKIYFSTLPHTTMNTELGTNIVFDGYRLVVPHTQEEVIAYMDKEVPLLESLREATEEEYMAYEDEVSSREADASPLVVEEEEEASLEEQDSAVQQAGQQTSSESPPLNSGLE